MSENPSSKGSMIKKLRRQFIAGVIVLVPVSASILILYWVFSTIDNVLQPLFRLLLNRTLPGAGFVATVILIYLAGVIASNVIGKRLIRYGESLVAKVPIVRQLYSGIKQILEGFSRPDKAGFMKVVLVEFPRKGMMAIGFITSEFYDSSGEKMLSVLIPTAPNPTTGFLQLVRDKDAIRTELSVDEAIRMIVSAGRVTPSAVGEKLPGED